MYNKPIRTLTKMILHQFIYENIVFVSLLTYFLVFFFLCNLKYVFVEIFNTIFEVNDRIKRYIQT